MTSFETKLGEVTRFCFKNDHLKKNNFKGQSCPAQTCALIFCPTTGKRCPDQISQSEFFRIFCTFFHCVITRFVSASAAMHPFIPSIQHPPSTSSIKIGPMKDSKSFVLKNMRDLIGCWSAFLVFVLCCCPRCCRSVSSHLSLFISFGLLCFW